MPFLARCKHCNQKLSAPSRKLHKRVRCPSCQKLIRLKPLSDPPAVATAAARDSGLHAGLDPHDDHDAVAAPVDDWPQQVTDIPDDGWPDLSPMTGAAGAVALILSGLALLCSAFEWSCGLVLPAAGLALFAGLAATVLAWVSDQSRPILPLCGSILSGLVLFVAALFPGLLSPTYQASREPAPTAAAALRVLPLPGQAGAVELANSGAVDASRGMLQQGPLSVRVLQAAVGPLEPKAKGDDVLLVRLRVHQVRGAPAYASPSDELIVLRPEVPVPKLTDAAGRTYPVREIRRVDPLEALRTTVFPTAILDEVFIFDRPPGEIEPLELEVAGTAWGGTATFRFAIPKAMIRPEPAGVLRPDRGGK
jgi:hypothetical protein